MDLLPVFVDEAEVVSSAKEGFLPALHHTMAKQIAAHERAVADAVDAVFFLGQISYETMDQVGFANTVGPVEYSTGLYADHLFQSFECGLCAGLFEYHRAIGKSGPTARAPEGFECGFHVVGRLMGCRI